MGDTRRMFVAVELPSVTLQDIKAVVAPLREEAPELAWTSAQERHITLKYLGEVPADGVDVLVQMLDAVAQAHRPFSIHLSRIGAFPNFRRAHVLWLGVEPEPRLELLQHDLELGAEGIGFEIEGRAFRPHVTLARVKTVLEPDRVRGLARAARKVDFSAVVHVAELSLFESTLVPTGPHYRRIHAATVGGR
ncbi:MAG: RNA 2',3'-cyclic phosphodiesterase [Gemmatimonadota bacterium]|nr:RNA 2',3'-cyclic phosphodiesterase [Gemmatimonadota bacterium]